MSALSESSTPFNACLACKQHKRKCDKTLPRCGTCLRVGRECVYEPSSVPSSSQQASSQPSRAPTFPPTPLASTIPIIGPPSHGLDPYKYDALRRPTVNTMLSLEAAKIFSNMADVSLMAERYFESSYVRMPMLSKARFFRELPQLFSKPRADFLLLCLSINLLLQPPRLPLQRETMQSTLYIAIKTYIATLEATNYVTLNFVQARLLVTFYETAHAIYPAASASIASCARLAHFLGLSRKDFQGREYENDRAVREHAEEEKRTWWAIRNLDRFIALCTGEKMLATDDPQSSDSLPIDDESWSRNEFPEAHSLNLLTPADITVGPFARECQILHLVGRVVRHVFDPPSDVDLLKEEAVQLERTLNAFVPLLMVEEEKFGFYCAALGLCSSALFTLYDAELQSQYYTEEEQRHLLDSLHETSTRIAAFSIHLFLENATKVHTNPDLFSPLIPHSIYQATIVQYRLWKQTGLQSYKDKMDSMRVILGGFCKRWQLADVYTEAFDNVDTPWPTTLFFLQNSGSAITGNPNAPFAP